jgi:CheY-like chemotaxis protein
MEGYDPVAPMLDYSAHPCREAGGDLSCIGSTPTATSTHASSASFSPTDGLGNVGRGALLASNAVAARTIIQIAQPRKRPSTLRRGHVRVAVGPEKNYAQLTVVDSGIGISTELLPRIFALFTQGDRTLDRAHGGLGLGLTLVKKLTERHGGSVTAANFGSNEGSAFVVTLPRIDTPSLRPQPAASSPLETTAAPRRIVIIEDNVDIRQGLHDLLVRLGHEVHEAGDGPRGSERRSLYSPTLREIGLPGFDGYEAARRPLSSYQGSEMVLIAVTGYLNDILQGSLTVASNRAS